MRDINILKQQVWQVEAKESQGNFHVDLMLQPSDMCFLSLIGTKCSSSKLVLISVTSKLCWDRFKAHLSDKYCYKRDAS